MLNDLRRQLSDKIILTPPYPGNQRGALWAESRQVLSPCLVHRKCANFLDSVSQSEWLAELEFRATGPERGGGNLQLWYAKDGRINIGTSSVYTVGNYDGMVLVIDPYGGKVQYP